MHGRPARLEAIITVTGVVHAMYVKYLLKNLETDRSTPQLKVRLSTVDFGFPFNARRSSFFF